MEQIDQSTSNLAGITNISIGIKDRSIIQQITNTQSEQLHYEQVFVTQIPTSTTAIAVAKNDEQNENQTKELHINRIKLNKTNDGIGQRSIENANVGPSTSSASATVTFSVAATNSNNSDTSSNSSITPLDAKSKEFVVKTKSSENETSILRRPILTRGLTEAVIMRSSRKDMNRSNAQVNQVNHFFFRRLLQSKKHFFFVFLFRVWQIEFNI